MDKREDDLDRELQSHLDLEAEEQGDRHAARKALGNLGRVKEDVREAWGWMWLERLGQDLRYALRTMRQSPGFTATAVLSLALGIGANTAIFSLIDALMLRWLPVRDPQELVQLRLLNGRRPPSDNFSYQEIRALGDQHDIFAGVAGYSAAGKFQIGPNDSLEQAWGAWVNGGFYETLGLLPMAGRLLGPSDNAKDAPPVAVITDAYWEKKFGRDLRAIGQRILVEGVPVTIIGVSSPGFIGASVGEVAELTMPIEVLPQILPGSAFLVNNGGAHWMRTLARPLRGTSVSQVNARLAVAWPQVARVAAPEGSRAQKELLASKAEALRGGGTGTTTLRRQFRQPLQVLMAVVGLVLLIACANVANLLLARSSARQREIAVRLAIGAGRARIIRQLLTESALLSLFGAALGVVFAWFTGSFLVSMLSSASTNGVVFDLTPNWHVLAFTSGVAIATGILLGLTPAFRATAAGPAPALKEGAHRGMWARLASSLVTVQVALSLLLAIGAGLFVRTLENLRNLDPGFRREGVLVANVDGQRAGYRDAALLAFYRELLERVEDLPGVASASLSASTPLGDVSLSTDVTIQGKIEEQKANLHLNMVTPRYFETMQMPLVQGREFTIRDDATASKVAMVNEAFVRRYFPGEPVLGRRISIGVSTGKRDDAEIVGVVRDTVAESLRQVPPAAVFLPYFQGGAQQFNTLEVRANGSIAQVLIVVRDELLSKLHTPPDVRTLTAMAERTLVQERLMATLAGAFGVLALVLACVGLYGLLAYSVAQRTKEMGIRMALGAQRSRVIGMVVKSAIRLVIIGIALGLPAAWAASRLVKSMLFGLTPTDPATMAGAALVMVSAALLAAYLPARRAARVDPMTALRHE